MKAVSPTCFLHPLLTGAFGGLGKQHQPRCCRLSHARASPQGPAPPDMSPFHTNLPKQERGFIQACNQNAEDSMGDELLYPRELESGGRAPPLPCQGDAKATLQ